MSATITPFPGTHCVHHRKGRCLLAENQNPGLHKEWQCQILSYLERAYDRFLEQADSFQLEIDLATRIWSKRLMDMLRDETPCENFVPLLPEDGRELEFELDGVACENSWSGLCLLAMPRCHGVCEKFEPPAD